MAKNFFIDEIYTKFHENWTSIASNRANMLIRQLLFHVLKKKSKYALKTGYVPGSGSCRDGYHLFSY